MFKLSGKFMWKKCGLYLSCLLSLGLMWACQEDESCVSFATNIYDVGFFTFDEEGGVVPVELNFDRVGSLGTDSLFFIRTEEGTSQIPLALNPASDTTTFLFRYGLGTDTLQLTYQRLFRMISPECGMELRYTQVAVSRHTFDSVSILKREPLRTPQELDLQIFQFGACESSFNSDLEAGFFALDQAGNPQAWTVNFERVRALESERVFYERNQAGINSLQLGLDTAEGANRTTFVFEDGEQADTLRLSYQQQQLIGSPECGLDTLYTNLRVIDHTFDSVSLLTPVLSETTDGFDIEIYP